MGLYIIDFDPGEISCFTYAIGSAIGRFNATDDNTATLLRLQEKLSNAATAASKLVKSGKLQEYMESQGFNFVDDDQVEF